MVERFTTILAASRLADRNGCAKTERPCACVGIWQSFRESLGDQSLKNWKNALRFVRLAAVSIAASASLAAAPFQSARTLDGVPFNPAGHVTIVHYWATWCAPCRIEMPILDAYYRKHHGQGLDVLAVSIDQGVSTRKLKDATAKFSFPVARVDDVKMPRRDIPSAIPVNRVYDKSGRLVFQSKGDGRSTIDMATLERVVTPLLR
jgi:cytochrome c biogenesis protein CcmG, thiol:disulfide interchange protein DsbE